MFQSRRSRPDTYWVGSNGTRGFLDSEHLLKWKKWMLSPPHLPELGDKTHFSDNYFFWFSTQIENSRLHKSHFPRSRARCWPIFERWTRITYRWMEKYHHSKLLSRNPCTQQWDVDIKPAWVGCVARFQSFQSVKSHDLQNFGMWRHCSWHGHIFVKFQWTTERVPGVTTWYNLCRKLRARSRTHLRL